MRDLFTESKRKTTDYAAVLLAVPKSAKHALAGRRGEGFVDTAIKILMAVVIGALVLGGLYALFNTTVLPTLTQRIQDMFNFKGA